MQYKKSHIFCRKPRNFKGYQFFPLPLFNDPLKNKIFTSLLGGSSESFFTSGFESLF